MSSSLLCALSPSLSLLHNMRSNSNAATRMINGWLDSWTNIFTARNGNLCRLLIADLVARYFEYRIGCLVIWINYHASYFSLEGAIAVTLT